MGSSKNTANIRSLLLGLFILVVGVCIGVLLGDLPFITFKREVDLGVCIAILGLIGTVFYIPYVVERKFAKLDNINEVIRADLESVHADVERLKEVYVAIKPSATVKEAQYTEILALFKAISSAVLALNKELEEHKRLKDFKKDVYDERFIPTKDACTESLIVGKKMDTKTILDAMTELNKLCATLKQYRYKTYSDN